MGEMTQVVGLDLGGSKRCGRLVAGGETVADARGPAGTVTLVDEGSLSRQLEELMELLHLGAAARLGVSAVCAGAAGAEAPSQRERLESLLSHLFPRARVSVVSDTALILPDAGARQVLSYPGLSWALDSPYWAYLVRAYEEVGEGTPTAALADPPHAP